MMRLALLACLALAACSQDFQPETREGSACVSRCQANDIGRSQAVVKFSPEYNQCVAACRKVDRDNIHNP